MQPLTEKPSGPAFWQTGFRPFFLLAALCAGVEMPLWAGLDPSILLYPEYYGPARGHAHEMLWGYAVAVIAGFLLTAARNWTNRPTASGVKLMVLAALWLAGRIAPWMTGFLPDGVIAACDLAFLPALVFVLARPIGLSHNRRNYGVPVFLCILWLANLGMHLDALGIAETANLSWQLGIMAILLLVSLIGGRVIPFFSERAIPGYRGQRSRAVEIESIVAIGLYALASLLPIAESIRGVLAFAVAALTASCWMLWHDLRIWRQPLLWILFIGYGWLPAGFAMLGAAHLGWWDDSFLSGTHALTVGCIATLTLGMMARVSLGHTGRELKLPLPALLAFVLVTLAAFVRIVMPWSEIRDYLTWIQVAGILWTIAFWLFLVSYWGVLVHPRVDGQPG